MCGVEGHIPDVHAHAGAIETAIPNSRRIVVSDVGHLMYIEKPEEFLTIVTHFLAFLRSIVSKSDLQEFSERSRSEWITAYPEITPKMEFCPGGRQSDRNLENSPTSRLEERIGVKATVERRVTCPESRLRPCANFRLPTMRQTSQAAHSETDQELLPPHEGWDQHAEHRRASSRDRDFRGPSTHSEA